MKRPVSIVIPALDDRALLGRALDTLWSALKDRGESDEVIVVDDSGAGRLAAWLAADHPRARAVVNAENLGFARALSAGVERAHHALVFAMNSDVCPRPGFLDPLVSAMGDPRVFAAVPRILLGGREDSIESVVSVELEGGIARGVQSALERPRKDLLAPPWWTRDGVTPFPMGGAFLFQRAVFLELGGFDRAFEPFYLEDMDLGWRAWKAGFECRYVYDAVVEHHHRGTIGAVVPEAVVRAAIERNRLLFTWKHLDDPAALEEHVRTLSRRVVEARVLEDRAFLTALCLALEDRVRAGDARDPLEGAATWQRIQAASAARRDF